MEQQFRKHYERDEARALLPQVRVWLRELREGRDLTAKLDERLGQMFAAHHQDLGGETVNQFVRAASRSRRALHEFRQREIQIKDLDRGLIDFPAILGGREVFLCWEEDEEDIEFWHDIDSGYAGRERL
jgi:hypothetical protein